MKPKDLKPPFTFATRKVLLEDGVFYVPDYFTEYENFSFPPWSSLFGNSLPVAIEFCAGNGAWIHERAERALQKNWVAIEKRFDRVRKIWSKKKNYNLENLFTVCGEANTFITNFVLEHSVDEIYINFPDPWPKKRHAKHRLMKEAFLEQIARITVKGGTITFVTDDQNYMASTRALFGLYKQFYEKSFTVNPIGYGSSYFDTLWREKGRTIYHVQYCTR